MGTFFPFFWKWKWWIVLKKDEMIKIWCISITNHVKSCKKINEHLPETDNVHITWSWVDWWSKLDWIEIEFQDEHLSHVGEVNWNENGKIKCESTSEVDWIRIGRKRQKSLDFQNVNFCPNKLTSNVNWKIKWWASGETDLENRSLGDLASGLNCPVCHHHHHPHHHHHHRRHHHHRLHHHHPPSQKLSNIIC